MLQSLRNPDPQLEPPEPRNRWAVVDLAVFLLFSFLMLVLLAPHIATLPVTYAIPLTGVFNLVLISFIAVWVTQVRGSSFAEYIHWFRNDTFSTRYLIILGAISALSVLVFSAFLPKPDQTPLEKLLNSRSAMFMFAIFGVSVAPLLEEIIFRGFLFKVLWEVGGSGVAIILSSAFFAVVHAPQLGGNWTSLILFFIVGCILSSVRKRSNSIIPSFIVHTSYNSMILAVSLIGMLVQKISPS